MKRAILGIILLAGVAVGQVPPSASGGTCAVLNADGSMKWTECAASPAIAKGASPGDCIQLISPSGIISYSCGLAGSPSLSCPPGGCPAVTHATISPNDTSDYDPRRVPSNEVVMQPLEYGKTYSGKAADVQILPRGEEAGGIWLAITAHVSADFAIIEVLHREVARIGGRDLKLFRSKTQAVRVSAGSAWLSDPIPLKLEDVEKINVRLVNESNVVEFWSDTSEIKKPVK